LGGYQRLEESTAWGEYESDVERTGNELGANYDLEEFIAGGISEVGGIKAAEFGKTEEDKIVQDNQPITTCLSSSTFVHSLPVDQDLSQLSQLTWLT